LLSGHFSRAFSASFFVLNFDKMTSSRRFLYWNSTHRNLADFISRFYSTTQQPDTNTKLRPLAELAFSDEGVDIFDTRFLGAEHIISGVGAR